MRDVHGSSRSGRQGGVVPLARPGKTVDAVESFLGRTYVAIRVIDLVQAVFAVCLLLRPRQHGSWLEVATVLVVAAESVFVGRRILLRGRYDEQWMAWLEVVVISAATLLAGMLAPAGSGVSTWAQWGYPFGLSVSAGLALPLRRRPAKAVGCLVLSVVYLASTGRALGLSTSAGRTVLVNVLAYPGFLVGLALLARFVRALGADADAARREAAQSARDLERLKAGRLVHDHVGLLRQVGDGDDGPLLRQAARGHARVAEEWLTGTVRDEGGFGGALRRVLDQYPDLAPTVSFDPCDRPVAPARLRAVCDALGTTLANVREHADARNVRVRLVDEGAGWTLTVLDDGRGFDPAATQPSFGTLHLLEPATWHDVVVSVESAPGRGTLVRLTGPW